MINEEGSFFALTYHHRCLLLFGHVHVGKENIDGQANHSTQKGDDADKDEELGVRGKVSGKVHFEGFGSSAICIYSWFMI